jgi:hypothetical protein
MKWRGGFVNLLARLSRACGAPAAVSDAISLDHSSFKGFGNRGGFQFVNDE